MAALVVVNPQWKRLSGVNYVEPTKVANAVETDLSTPDTSIVLSGIGVRLLSLYLKFANYTSVTVKLQESVDGVNYKDVSGKTTSTTDTLVKLTPVDSPYIRVSIAGTLSASADTLEVWLYAEKYRDS